MVLEVLGNLAGEGRLEVLLDEGKPERALAEGMPEQVLEDCTLEGRAELDIQLGNKPAEGVGQGRLPVQLAA